MKYKILADVYEKLEKTSSRIEKTYIISQFLKDVDTKLIDRVALLLQGLIFPLWDDRKLGVSTQLIIKALSKAYGIESSKLIEWWKEKGDLGLVAEEAAKNKRQVTLFQKELEIEKVISNFDKIVSLEGEGSIDMKISLVAQLLTNASPKEARYIVRTILEDLRVGVGEGIVRDAIIWAFLPKFEHIFYRCSNCKELVPAIDKCLNCSKPLIVTTNFKDLKTIKILSVKEFEEKLKDLGDYDFILFLNQNLARECYNKVVDLTEELYSITNDYGKVAQLIIEKKFLAFEDTSLILGVPIRVMLAQKVESLQELFEVVGVPAFLEYKYDGFRMIIHKWIENNEVKVKIFTRRLEDVTNQFPDVVEVVKNHIKADSFIIDSECVGIDKDGRYLPFQKISQRIKRKYDIEEIAKKIPVELNVFDILYYNGETIYKKPFEERRKILERVVENVPGKIKLARQIKTSSQEEAEKFFKEAVEEGTEGIMGKRINAPYKPGKRVGYMVKYKAIRDTFDLVIVGAEWGEGKRANWLTSYKVSCYDPVTNEFLVVGKVSTGLKEKSSDGVTFEQMTSLLKPYIVEENGREVKISPKIVISVAYEEIQKSPQYESGYALRFPRFVDLRLDKMPEEATTFAEIVNSYRKQFFQKKNEE